MDPSPTRSTIDLERVRDAIAPVLAAHSVALVELEWLTERVGWTLRITIERLEGTANADPRSPSETSLDAGGGVTLDDCADVSRDVSSVLDVEDLIPQRYNLEVSSPGLDRRLRTPVDLPRFAGRTVKVKLARPAPDGQRLLRGELAAASAGRIAVVVDGKRIEALLEDVIEARLVFELAPQPKKKGRRRAEAEPKTAGALRDQAAPRLRASEVRPDGPGKRRSERS